MNLLITVLLSFLLFVNPALADPVQVVRVVDGDTIVVMLNGTPTSTRLACIDSPEVARYNVDKLTTDTIKKDQYLWGDISKAMTDYLVEDTIDLRPTDIDRYGRLVADITLPNGKNLQEELLRRGLTTIYPKYFKQCPNAEGKTRAQEEAMAYGWAIWSDSKYQAPWVFRRKKLTAHLVY